MISVKPASIKPTPFLAALILFLVTAGNGVAENGSRKVTVTIDWKYRNVPARIKLFEAKGTPTMWKTASVKHESSVPAGREIPDSTLIMKPGESRLLVLVMRNTTDRPIHFFAAPHEVTPPESSLGFKFYCLCVNMTYTVRPGEVWYRVVKLTLFPGHVGDAVKVVHTLVAIEKPVNVFQRSDHHDM